MVRFLSYLSLVLLVITVTGCARPLRSDPQLVAQPDRVSALLADAADRAASSLETLASVEQARTPRTDISPIKDAPQDLRRAITVNWVGPVEPIAKTLADRAGYSFQTLGDPPPVPIVVSINVENKPVIDVLRNLGLQLGSRADVKVNGDRRLVEIQYASNMGAGG